MISFSVNVHSPKVSVSKSEFEQFFTRPGLQAGLSQGIDVSVCVSVCFFVPPHIFFHDGYPIRRIYLGPPILLQIPDPL